LCKALLALLRLTDAPHERARTVPPPFLPMPVSSRSSEFIPIKPSTAREWGAPGSYVGYSRFPSPDRGHPASTGHRRSRSFTMRQRLTLLLTCSIHSRCWCSAWLALAYSSVSSWPRGFFVGMRLSTWGSVNARKPNPVTTGSRQVRDTGSRRQSAYHGRGLQRSRLGRGW